MSKAIEDFLILDLSEHVAGPFCTKLLADQGARVIKIERPHVGDVARTLGPFPGDEVHLEKSGLFLYLNTNKRSVVTDIETAEGKTIVRALASQADALVESFAPGRMVELGLSYESLSARNDRLVMTSISHFGQTGPYRDRVGDEIVDYAMCAVMYQAGDPKRAPLMVPGYQAQLHAGLQGALATLAALRLAKDTGRGNYIDLSILEAFQMNDSVGSVAWSCEGWIPRRKGSDLFKCKDGWVYFARMFYNTNIFLLIERYDLLDDPISSPNGFFERSEELWSLVADWCADRTMEEIVQAGQELRILVSAVNTVADLLNSEHLKAREWFVELDHPVAGRLRYPGSGYRLQDSPCKPLAPAPLLGQHTDEVLAGLRRDGTEHSRVVPPMINRKDSDGAEAELPLKGVRILEMTWQWAGPLACLLLADLGAEVIKIEYASKPATRSAYPPAGEPGKYHWNRAGYFNRLNRNKRGICLNLRKPEGRELFLQLVKQSDAVIENNSSRVMPQLKLDYPVLRQVNERIIMLSMSGYGATGPWRDYVGMGANIETTSGLVSLTGYREGDLYRSGSYHADPISACYGALAVLVALERRRHSGQGQFIDVALNECGSSFLAEPVMDYTINSRLRRPMGNRHVKFAPQGCYPCFGKDMWMVLTIRSDQEWARFCAAIGQPELTGHVKYATETARCTHHDELDELIANWTKQHDHQEATRVLQAAGIAAGPVVVNWELLSDTHLHERGFFLPINHPEVGVYPLPGPPWKLSSIAAPSRRPAPLFGQHNDYVLKEILGLSQAQVDDLVAKEVTAYQPTDFPAPVASSWHW